MAKYNGVQPSVKPALILKDAPADGSLRWFATKSGKRHELWRSRIPTRRQFAPYLPARQVAVVVQEDGGHDWQVTIYGRNRIDANFVTVYEAKAWTTAMVGLGEAG